jgi:transcriptional regulator with XRE-family HTH domain
MSLPDIASAARRIATRAREARLAAGLSQGQAASKLGIARSTLTEAETGNRKISAAELSAMADIYDVSLSWLAARDADSDDPQRDHVELAARELAHLDPDALRTVIQFAKSIRAKDG